jgi:hypothetical protein
MWPLSRIGWEPEWNDKSTEFGIVAGQGLEIISK